MNEISTCGIICLWSASPLHVHGWRPAEVGWVAPIADGAGLPARDHRPRGSRGTAPHLAGPVSRVVFRSRRYPPTDTSGHASATSFVRPEQKGILPGDIAALADAGAELRDASRILGRE